MKKTWSLFLGIAVSVLLIVVVVACGPTEPTEVPPTLTPTLVPPTATVAPQSNTGSDFVTASGLHYIEIQAGDGPAPQPGDVVAVHYRGTLQDGTEFDNSYDRGQPFVFALGRGMVIPGWDEGIALMKVGGKARLIIPPELGYGVQGAGEAIPPNATLIFEVELVEILPGSPDAPTQVAEADYVTTDSGLKYYDLEVGSGPAPKQGQVVSVHYTAWLTDGTKIDSSLDRGQPLNFPLGTDQVIPGWDEGVATMQVGGKRQLVIPSELAYGPEGFRDLIPPNATLVLEIELVDVGP